MPATSYSAATVPACTTQFIYQTSTTSSSDVCWYNDPIARWLDVMDELHEAARQRQRATWFAPRKVVRVMAPVLPVRRYQKAFQGHLFAPGGKK